MIIVSITGPGMSDALAQVAGSASVADAFEFRLDLIRSPELAILMLSTPKPVIATCRAAWEGGGFRKTEADRMEILRAASLLGADYVDLELGTHRQLLAEFLTRRKETRVIVSHHVEAGKRFDARRVYKMMRATDADVLKFAFHASDAWQNRIAFDFLADAKKDGRSAVAIAMGEAGEPSRILYRVFGGWGTYAATDERHAAAPGQIAARVLKDLYHADRLSARTTVFGVVGDPVGHSRGIYVHNPLFHQAGKNAVYCRWKVRDLRRFMSAVAPLLSGFSVTLPHKERMLRYVGSVDATARAIGAVNTVVRRRGQLWGTNTDAPGALDAIEQVALVRGKRVLVLGAGGAARAIAFEARQRGAHVIVANRTASKAKRLAAEFGIGFVPFGEFAGTPFDVFVNATSVGMWPHVHRTPVPARALAGKIVLDVVYHPPLTRLLRDAVEAGARIVPGTDMYVNQGARQFRLYAGIPADVRMMKKLLREHQ